MISTLVRRLAFSALAALLAPALPAQAQAQPSAQAALAQKQMAWRQAMRTTRAKAPGCYTAAYPRKQWVSTACGAPPPGDRVFQAGPPDYGAADNMVQAGGSVTGTAGSITSATGSLFDAFGLVSEVVTSGPNNGTQNVYSLQMNTNNFATPRWCTSAQPAGCNGFQQFIFVNNDSDANGDGGRRSYVFIEYVLNNYGKCPAGWLPSNGGCYLGSASTAVPVQGLAAFSGMTLTGGIVNGNDTVTLELANNVMYQYQASGSLLNLSGWNQVQFNVFGDATIANATTGAQANFNPGASMQVTTTINAQPGLTVQCFKNSLTGETANLAAASSCSVLGGANYGIKFVQGAAPVNITISPDSGPANGGTPVDIHGVGFTKSMQVAFGGSYLIPVCDSTTHCVVTAPPGSGSVDIRIANLEPNYLVPGLFSAAVPADVFSYGPATPTAALSPRQGSPLGGTTATAQLTNFVAGEGTVVTFDFPGLATPATAVSCQPTGTTGHDSSCTLQTPPLDPPGPGPVATPVTLSYGGTTLALGTFTFETPQPVKTPCAVCRESGGICSTKNGKFVCQCQRSSPTGLCQ